MADEEEAQPQAAAPDDNEVAVHDIGVDVYVRLGATKMLVRHLLRMGRGAVVDLDQNIHEPVVLVANGRIIARGEVVVVDEDRLGVQITELTRGG